MFTLFCVCLSAFPSVGLQLKTNSVKNHLYQTIIDDNVIYLEAIYVNTDVAFVKVHPNTEIMKF